MDKKIAKVKGAESKKTKSPEKIKTPKTKISLPATVALMAGFVLGGALIVFGANRQIASEHPEVSVRSEEEIKKDINDAYAEANNLRARRNEISDTESAEYAETSNDLVNAEAKRANFEEELLRANSGSKVSPKVEATFDGAPFIVTGSVVVALGVAMSFFMLSRNTAREAARGAREKATKK